MMRHFTHAHEAMHWSEMRPATAPRKRTPNVARYIRQARKAGDNGPVRVEITDAKGRAVTITSNQQQDQPSIVDSNPWDEVSKHATH